MPNTRTTDPTTSHEAARSISKLAETYSMITHLFKTYGPMNDQRLLEVWDKAQLKPISDSGLRSRRSELVAAGKLVDSYERTPMPSGRQSIVWSIA